MPKLKAHKASAKRFKVTKSGNVKYAKANRGHFLTEKSQSRKRHFRFITNARIRFYRRNCRNVIRQPFHCEKKTQCFAKQRFGIPYARRSATQQYEQFLP